MCLAASSRTLSSIDMLLDPPRCSGMNRCKGQGLDGISTPCCSISRRMVEWTSPPKRTLGTIACPAITSSLYNQTLSRKEGCRKRQARLPVNFHKKKILAGVASSIPATQPKQKPTMATTSPAELPSVGTFLNSNHLSPSSLTFQGNL